MVPSLSRIRPILLTGLLATLTGLALLLAACQGGPGPTSTPTATAKVTNADNAPAPPESTPSPATQRSTPAVAGTPRLVAPVTVALDPALPETYVNPLLAKLSQMTSLVTEEGPRPLLVLDRPERAQAWIGLQPLGQAQHPIGERFYAVVVPFATVQDDVPLEELAARWRGEGPGPLLLGSEESLDVAAVLGEAVGKPPSILSPDALLDALEETPDALGILPFHRLDPRFKVLTVDGVNVLSNRLDPASYPLALALDVQGEEAEALAQSLAGVIQPTSNRDASQLTTLIMTGVTAMSRATAARMEAMGPLYPALVISDTLRAADITHVSNEVPFLSDCVVNNSVDNLVLCSHTDYWAALEAIGTDIVGLSGNHVNDFGRDGARESIQFYRDKQIPIYGSGLNVEEACAPLLWEHNGNRFAFIAALAFWPQTAWATEDQPGACYFYDNEERILESIRELRPQVDIIAVELQYQESYDPRPLQDQVLTFRELREAGADIVTGVQSHVPQAMEPYGPEESRGPSIIVYGLGNLFFDQMWSWQTRTELIARHTIYQGRLISTEILTAVLEDYAQPRWATPEERAEILQRIFNAAPFRP